MKSEFDEVIDRTGTNSEKWSASASEGLSKAPIPMWVADMDFRAPTAVLSALREAVNHGVFGYAYPTKNFIQAVTGWQQVRHGWDPDPAWLLHTAGVVAALSQIVRAFTSENDAVLVQSPVYGRFHKVPSVNGRRVVNAPLKATDNSYMFDAVEFESIIRKHQPKLFILCHPHNPVGKVWTEEELRQMGEICLAHDVLVVSDEIHQDLVFNLSKRHIPYASLGEKFAQNCIICTAPSKTFNLAGLQVSNLFIPNPAIREKLAHELDRNGNHGVNSLGMIACEAAYRHGSAWLDELLGYIASNHSHFAEEIKAIPGLKTFHSDALYLAWLDCRGLGMSDDALYDFMLCKAGVHLDSGLKFGAGGQGFMRINLGCPRATLDKAIAGIKGAFQALPS